MEDYFRSYSKLRRIISDRGSTFTSDEFKEFLNRQSIEHVLIAVATPRANGPVERKNRSLTPMLAKLTENPQKWDHVIHLAEFSFNSTRCRSTGNTPSQLLFGIEQSGEVNDTARLILHDQAMINRDLLRLREEAAQKITANQTANEKSFNRSRKEATAYVEGDYVMITNTDTTPVNKKLIPKYKGPYVIYKSLGPDRYVVRDIPEFQVTQIPYNSVVSADHMKPWIK